MAVPKRKMSRSNTRHRRSAWKAIAPPLVTLRQPRLPLAGSCRTAPAPSAASTAPGPSVVRFSEPAVVPELPERT